VTVAGLVAAAVFLLVAVDAFRKNAGPVTERDSGTGGFALMAESGADRARLQTREDARRWVWRTRRPARWQAWIFRPAPAAGDDASCLNLPSPGGHASPGAGSAIRESRFRFGATIATGDAGRSSPWTCPRVRPIATRRAGDRRRDVARYVLHAGVGDTITVDADTSHPLRLPHRRRARRFGVAGRGADRRSRFRLRFQKSPATGVFLGP
jgi:hypothetical protein